ncbi:two-component system response regulator [Roseivirga seohaensis]|uniref:Two-component system response regulator n=1 Tax=Roseivirga seohaensis TaxID=1914963 RepID=A0A150XZP8_9BACT|nr:response regulator transcription factor [Roseivirga seohaensis]KYG84237.1 two-component system response regulator [Roseivirga seohaensis]
MKILLIEDEVKLGNFLVKGLEEEGYSVAHETNGSEALETAATNDFDLILLDIMLPGQNGFEVLKNMREFSIHTPIIFMSALNESEHVIKGLDLGAIDYVKKPFDFEELKARVRNVQRKFGSTRASTLQVKDLKVDLIKREVTRADQLIELSKREFSILELLMSNTNRVLSKSEITQKIWNINFDRGSNVVEVHMHQLRKKIDFDFEPKLIETQVGYGYKIQGELVKS